MSNPADFIGRGFRFPLQVDHAGGIAMGDGPDEIDSSIYVILMTAPGERVMRPRFGCRIWEMLFESVNPNTLGLMRRAVIEALGQWEPRIDVEDVRCEPEVDKAGSCVRIHIDYRVKVTNDHRNLVYPFYIIPREDES